MKKVIIIISIGLVSLTSHVRAQFVTIDPAHIAASILNTANEIIQTSSTVSNVINNWREVEKVYKQGKEYYDALKAVNDLVRDAKKVRDAILIVGEIGDIYYHAYQKMLQDGNYTFEELAAISNGFTYLIQESINMLQEIREVVNVNGLSMTDAERMNIVNGVYFRLVKHRNLVQYYTRKMIHVSYVRSSRTNDTSRFFGLYGSSDEKYW